MYSDVMCMPLDTIQVIKNNVSSEIQQSQLTSIQKGMATYAGLGNSLDRQREVEHCRKGCIQIAAQVVVPPLRITVTILQM
jgi:hypothetical protein